MASGDLSMPTRFGTSCNCVAITAYRARRWFIGASLGCVATNGASINGKHYFLRYRQVSTGYPANRNGDFVIDWSTDHADYGTGVISGSVPTAGPNIPQPSRQVIGGSIKGMGPLFPGFPNQITATGAYIFQATNQWSNQVFADQFPYSLVSFTAGTELTVELRTTISASLGGGNLVQYFTRHLNTTRMMDVINLDYADSVGRSFQVATVSRPVAGPWEDYGVPPFKGGVETSDLIDPRYVFWDGYLDFSTDLNWPINRSAIRYVDPNTETLQHAPNVGNNFIAPNPGILHWILIRTPGANLLELRNYPSDTLISSGPIVVDCFQGTLIEPPVDNFRAYAVGQF